MLVPVDTVDGDETTVTYSTPESLLLFLIFLLMTSDFESCNSRDTDGREEEELEGRLIREVFSPKTIELLSSPEAFDVC